jgi:hypothetical protein
VYVLPDWSINQSFPIIRFHGLESWAHPFSQEPYLGIQGPWGRFLGFWAALMQAGFSFFGSEVPGIAAGEFWLPCSPIQLFMLYAGEVIDATIVSILSYIIVEI